MIMFYKLGLRTGEIEKSEYNDVVETIDTYMDVIDKTMRDYY